MKLTKPQQESLLALWRRSPGGRTFLQFRRTVFRETFGDAAMVLWCGMWIGIEQDGYTHS